MKPKSNRIQPQKHVGYSRLRKWTALIILLLCLLSIITLVLCPLRNTVIRLTLVSLLIILWFTLLCFCWPLRKVRHCFLGLSLLFCLFIAMPPRRFDMNELRREYIRSLLRYKSVPYFLGAEGFSAIDCSGLVRQGFVDACFIRGLKTLNGGLVRYALLLWWHDCSAKAMRDRYQGRTELLFKAQNLNLLDHETLLPGDIAVTQSGAHCLVYLGENQWIQADPVQDKVIVETIPSDSGWFLMPVFIMEWTPLHDLR